jgi:hypothetical protein
MLLYPLYYCCFLSYCVTVNAAHMYTLHLQASELYMAFVLQKVDSPQAVHAPPLPPPDKLAQGPHSQQQRNQHQHQHQQRQSPTREQRLAGGGGRPPPLQQQQQPDGAMAWRGGGNRKRVSCSMICRQPPRMKRWLYMPVSSHGCACSP